MFRLPQISLPKGRSVNIVLVITGILTALPLGPVLGAPVGRHTVRCDAKNDHVDINKYVPEPGTIFHDIYAGDLAAVDTRVKAHPALVKSLEAKTFFTPLHFAALYNKPDIAAFLIAHGSNVNALHLNYATPLHLAARSGSLSVAKLLVAHGAKLNVTDKDYGCSPLLVAALNGKTDVAEFLVGKGADLKIKNDDEFDVLYASTFHDNIPLVKFLLAKGMDIETTNVMGFTPVGVAVLNNLPTMVDFLLTKGANPNPTSGPQSPLALATQGGRTDTAPIVANLKNHRAIYRKGEHDEQLTSSSPPMPNPAPTVMTALQGSIEGEDLIPTAIATSGRIDNQSMNRFSGNWSRGAQLFWWQQKPGDILTFHLTNRAAGSRKITGYFTKAPDYGTVTFSIGGQSLPNGFDGYNANVVNSGPVTLGTVMLPAGPVDLVVKVTGRNPLSGNYFFGMDAITAE